MGYLSGVGYKSSNGLETSTLDLEIIPKNDLNFPYAFNKFSFYNLADCNVIINEKDSVFLPAYQNFITDEFDAQISSFVIKEEGIKFNWIGRHNE